MSVTWCFRGLYPLDLDVCQAQMAVIDARRYAMKQNQHYNLISGMRQMLFLDEVEISTVEMIAYDSKEKKNQLNMHWIHT